MNTYCCVGLIDEEKEAVHELINIFSHSSLAPDLINRSYTIDLDQVYQSWDTGFIQMEQVHTAPLQSYYHVLTVLLSPI